MHRHQLGVKGEYRVVHKRDGKVLHDKAGHNSLTTAGLDHMLNCMFNGATQSGNWYLGLVASDPTFDADDTMASHAGWTEFDDYSELTRQLWNCGDAEDNVESRKVANDTAAEFTVDANGTISGIFVTTVNTKGGATGTLWATAQLDEELDVQIGDTIEVYYTVSIRDDNAD